MSILEVFSKLDRDGLKTMPNKYFQQTGVDWMVSVPVTSLLKRQVQLYVWVSCSQRLSWESGLPLNLGYAGNNLEGLGFQLFYCRSQDKLLGFGKTIGNKFQPIAEKHQLRFKFIL